MTQEPSIKVEEAMSPKETTLSVVLDAVKELTTTIADLVEAVEEMRKEYGLKKRAGVFDQKGIT